MSVENGTKRRPVRVAILGCGSVGAAVAQRLIEDGEGLGLSLVKVLVRDATRDRGIDQKPLTSRFEDVLESEPDLVIEVLGGVKPAEAYVSRCLERGISVVSANKTLIAHRGEALREIAARSGAAFAYEAAVCSAIPVLAALKQFEADQVESITAIVNGSCNFILGRMSKHRATLEEAVARAGQLGFVEPDPSADLSGRDSAEKLCLLADAIGERGVTPDRVEVEGIERITREDIRQAKASGLVVKLVAELSRDEDGVCLRVGPTLVARDHPLASVENEDNGILVETRHAGELFLRGRGAGPGPTASAILGDVVRIVGSVRVVASGAGVRARPVRSSQVRVRSTRGAVDPRVVFDALEESGASAEELMLTRSGAVVLTQTPWTLAESFGRTFADERDVLVMPILESDEETALRDSA